MRYQTQRHKDLFLKETDVSWWFAHLKDEAVRGRNPYKVGHESWRQVSDLMVLALEVLNEKTSAG